MSSAPDLLNVSYIASTALGVTGGSGAVWAVVKVYIKFILRDLSKLDGRVQRLEERAADHRGSTCARV